MVLETSSTIVTSDALRNLAARISDADAHQEPALVFESLHALSPDEKALAPGTRFARIGAYHEAVIAMVCSVLPDFAFQFGTLPVPASRRGCAQMWRTGDASARVYCAATPVLALLKATCSEAAARAERLKLSRCRRCKGLGWTIAPNGGRHICQHTDADQATGALPIVSRSDEGLRQGAR